MHIVETFWLETDILQVIFVFLLGSSSAAPDGKVLFPEKYSLFHRPVIIQTEVMNISVGIVITQIHNIDLKDSAIDFNIEFIVSWVDELIGIEEGRDGKVRLHNTSDIWTPDLYIYDLIKFNIRNIANYVSHIVLIKNGSEVRVSHAFEAEVMISCDGQSANFPFQRHDCFLAIGSLPIS